MSEEFKVEIINPDKSFLEKEDAIEVAMPIIIGSPPISRTMGPNTANVAALLIKLVNNPVNITEINHRTMNKSLKTYSKFEIAVSATQNAAPVSFIWIPKDIADPKSKITPQLVLPLISFQSIKPNER